MAGLRWRLNLEVLRDDMAKIAGFPEFPAGRTYRGPTLVVRGGASDYVDDEGLAAFAGLFPGFRLVTVPAPAIGSRPRRPTHSWPP